MGKFDVVRAGTDVYGRPVFMTEFYRDWEEARWDALGFRLPYAQGGFMTRLGGGAEASSGAHDRAKCCDYILEAFDHPRSRAVVREFRAHGGGAYRRDRPAKYGGMPLHLHNTLGADDQGAPMAELLWASYVSGGDGLGEAPGRPAGAPDYEWRPSPLVLTPPKEEALMVTKEDEAKIRAIVADEATKATRAELARLFRDESGDGVDIGRARIISRDGKTVVTLSDLLFAAANRRAE